MLALPFSPHKIVRFFIPVLVFFVLNGVAGEPAKPKEIIEKTSNTTGDTTEAICEFIAKHSSLLGAKSYEIDHARHVAYEQLMGYFPVFGTQLTYQTTGFCKTAPGRIAALNLSQQLLSGYGPLQKYSQAMYDVRSATQLYAAAENDLWIDATGKVIQYTLQHASYNAAGQLLVLRDTEADQAQEGFRTGLVAFIERDQAVQEAASQRIQTLFPQREQTVLHQQLSAMASDAAIPYVPSYVWDRQRELFIRVAYHETLPGLVDLARNNDARIKSLDERINQAAYLTRALVWSYLPTLSWGFTITNQNAPFELISSFPETYWQMGISLNWNFDGWLQFEESHIADIDRCRLLCEKLSELNTYEQKIAQEHKNLVNALELGKTKRELVRVAREEYEKQQALFSAGLASVVDIETAHSHLTQLQYEEEELASQVAMAYETIDSITGYTLEHTVTKKMGSGA